MSGQREGETKCICAWLCANVSQLKFVLFARTVHPCVLMHPCPFCMGTLVGISFWHLCLNAHLDLNWSVTDQCTCTTCACRTDIRVFVGFISELWTPCVHVEARPIYPILFTRAATAWDSTSCLLLLLCSFKTRKMACFDWIQLQESLQLEAFPVCSLEESWKNQTSIQCKVFWFKDHASLVQLKQIPFSNLY